MEGGFSFAVACGEPAEVFEAVEAAFDAVAELIKGAVVWALYLAVDLGRDDGFGTDCLDGSNDGAGVVFTVGHDDLGLTTGKQGKRFGKLTGLAAREPESDRLSQAVCEQVNLGAQSTSGTPQSLVFGAPFLRPVAAC